MGISVQHQLGHGHEVSLSSLVGLCKALEHKCLQGELQKVSAEIS